MEEKILKTMAQLGFLAMLIWVLAAVLGRRSEATVINSAQPRRRGKGDRWAFSPMVGERVSTLNTVAVSPLVRWA